MPFIVIVLPGADSCADDAQRAGAKRAVPVRRVRGGRGSNAGAAAGERPGHDAGPTPADGYGGRRARDRPGCPGRQPWRGAPPAAARPRLTRTRDITGLCWTNQANRASERYEVMIRRDDHGNGGGGGMTPRPEAWGGDRKSTR